MAWRKESERHVLASRGIKTKDIKHKLISHGRQDRITATFGPGKYYLGDTCYVLDDNIYHGIWGDKYGFDDGLIHTPHGDYVVASTAYGDGTFEDDSTEGIIYGVDAGSIGLVPLSLATKEKPGIKHGRVIDVKNKIIFNAQNGQFHVTWDDRHSLTINTGDEESGNNEEEY